MHEIVVILIAGVVAGALVWGFRGWISRELVASKADLTGFAGRLEAAAQKDINSFKNDVLAVAHDIRAKL